MSGQNEQPRAAPPGARFYHHREPFTLRWGGRLPGFTLAYETWGTLDAEAGNAVLLCTGLSASSHARSHERDTTPGWWEEMIGPGGFIDTDRHFVICSNVLGGCFGSTGPASPRDASGRRWATDFPIITIWDMVAAQARLLDHLGIRCLDTVLGASMGGMQAMAFAAAMPARTRRVVSISAPGRSYPLSISLRFVQRQAVMRDPRWRGGHYYDAEPPRDGLHVARQIGTITYRSGPEWDRRFARERTIDGPPTFDVDYQVESYVVHQGDRFVERFDANSYLYLSKAMDLFDLGDDAPSYEDGVARIHARSLLVGVTTDLLFPIHQTEEVARILRQWGRDCRFIRLDSVYGHDAFLIEIERFGRVIRGFLEEPAPPPPRDRPAGSGSDGWDAIASG
ncbi:MAG: homoserine O-acetyltransferase [Acidobacteria bacterium]|nr:MAG: homoserine O-acetyltransferase [Acidobacteriota bacterium]